MEMALNIHEKRFQIPHTLSDWKKKWKIRNNLCLQAFSLAPKIVRRRLAWKLARGVRRVSPGEVIVVLFSTKYVVPRLIKTGIIKLTLKTGQINFLIALTSVTFEEKGYYRVVLVGHLSFDCRSYCGGQPPFSRRLLASWELSCTL